MAGPRIVVAMSGGVDSSVAAALLKAQGFDVIGVSMQLSATPAATVRAGQGCCSLEDFRDARRVAERLAIPYYVWNLTDTFRARVTDVFASEYVRGRTPNPCVLCNRDLKFDELRTRAGALGAALVATGHYARILREDDGRFRLLRARDERKDQSYFLFSLAQEELARTRFPLGDLTKEEVRRHARALGLPVAEKPESQEICFVPDRDYAGWVERHALAGDLKPGAIKDADGRTLAVHGGVHRFTVGQRRRLGIGDGVARWVTRIDGATGTVHVGGRDALANRGLVAEQVRWTAGAPVTDGDVRVRIRHRHAPVAARLRHTADDRVEAWFDEPATAVTPGQAAVFYRGEEVLGGGWIAEAL
ncbi:MAG: tRNA 2-thiouridine(34) synthase MnmA [Deltaproteobacteria bacterium]|nr:tRNA 2-thiouridine(34) synthase MnmA [Deltaproteobacteria bacterium]